MGGSVYSFLPECAESDIRVEGQYRAPSPPINIVCLSPPYVLRGHCRDARSENNPHRGLPPHRHVKSRRKQLIISYDIALIVVAFSSASFSILLSAVLNKASKASKPAPQFGGVVDLKSPFSSASTIYEVVSESIELASCVPPAPELNDSIFSRNQGGSWTTGLKPPLTSHFVYLKPPISP